jgi:hypothetical protein
MTDDICRSVERMIDHAERNGLQTTHVFSPAVVVEDLRQQFPGLIVTPVKRGLAIESVRNMRRHD